MDKEAASLAVYILFVISVPTIVVIGSWLLGPRRHSAEKLSPYECGVPLLQGMPEAIRVRYYLVAILFLLFDVEIALLIGWSVVHRSLASVHPSLTWTMPLAVLFFLLLLAIGLVYDVKKGALQWD